MGDGSEREPAKPVQSPTSPEAVFAGRAAFYTTSEAHTDAEVLQHVVELCHPRKSCRALDVATGTGHTAFALAPYVAMVVGVDATPEMLAEGEKLKARRGVSNVTFEVGDAHRLRFAAQSFEVVTCRRAAHHFTDVRKALAEMRRVATAQGRLVIDDRSVPEDDFVDACMNELDRCHDPSHVREYRPSEWQAMLAETGWRAEVLEPYVRHRPLRSLTEQAAPEDAGRIRATLDALDERQRRALHLVQVNGEWYSNHWYVMIAAVAACGAAKELCG